MLLLPRLCCKSGYSCPGGSCWPGGWTVMGRWLKGQGGARVGLAGRASTLGARHADQG